MGTEFTIYDKGVKPADAQAAGMLASAMRAELGAVVYQYNVLGTRGPRKMTAMIPAVRFPLPPRAPHASQPCLEPSRGCSFCPSPLS